MNAVVLILWSAILSGLISVILAWSMDASWGWVALSYVIGGNIGSVLSCALIAATRRGDDTVFEGD
jgi:hypothetical protein